MKRSAILTAAITVALLATFLVAAQASAWNLGITFHEECAGYGVDVNPGVYHSGIYKYVPYETQVDQGGGWNPVPYSDYSGSLNPWNPSGLHNYEVKIRYHIYKRVGGQWVLQSGVHTEGPIHKRVVKPDDCYEVCSETVETGPVDTYSEWSDWVYNPSTGMEESFQTITHTYTLVDAKDGQTICGTREVKETKTRTRWPKDDFNLTSMCRLSDGSGQLRIRNNSTLPQEFTLHRVGDGYEITGTAPLGDSLYTVPYGSSSDTWILEISGWKFTKAIGHNDYCEAQYKLTTNNCEKWQVTEYTSPEDKGTVVDEGYWQNPYITETADSYGFHIVEPSDCKIVHNGTVDLDNSCDGWSIYYIMDDQKVVIASGVWTKPNKLETAEYDAFEIPVPEGEDIEISDPQNLRAGGTISEPSTCFVCKKSEKYRMITLLDTDAPDYYLGQGGRNGTCYVIMHDDATGVATWRQAEICSVCSHPEFVYEADKVLYDGWVVVDCLGNISYPDPMWKPEWYKANFDGICHEDSCLDPAVKPPVPDTAQ